MARPKSLTASSPLNVHIDAGLKARMDAALYSELEERVPHGAYQRFFNLILTQALSFKALDLAPFLGTDPGVAVVRGTPEVINALKAHLEQR
jgi:hypothetical protein